MGNSDLMVGLEIGTSKICVVVGEGRPDGTIKILGVGQSPSRGVRKGEIVDFETAMKCVHEAVVDAEQKSDVMIRSVYVAVAGAHIQSFNNRGGITLPEDRDEIDEQDVEDVKINAREVSIPGQNAFLHSIIQHYHVDGQDGVLNPIGMLGHKLEADFHIIHGVRTRIQNTIRCVKELPLEVEDVVFSALASAQVVLTQHQKNLGALVIDIGGGTTDYILYVDGAVKQSGAFGVGGDHITNDISMGLRIPMARAEKLKIVSGIDHLAQEIFEMPAHAAHAQTMSGLTSAFENPQFSTAIGLIKYAQAVQADRPRRGIGRILGRLFSGMR